MLKLTLVVKLGLLRNVVGTHYTLVGMIPENWNAAAFVEALTSYITSCTKLRPPKIAGILNLLKL